MAGAARKCWRALALSSPLPRRTHGSVCKPRLFCDARSPDAGALQAPWLASKSRHHVAQRALSWMRAPLFLLRQPPKLVLFINCHLDMLSVYASADQSSQAHARSCWLVIPRLLNKLSTQARNDSSFVIWVSLHPIPNSFLPQKASLVRKRSWINYIRPILIQWLLAMLRCVTAPRLNYAWTRVWTIESECPSPKLSIQPWVSANTDKATHTYMHVNTGHHHLREQIPFASGGSAQTQRERPNSAGAPKLEPIEWISWPSLAGAPKLGGSAQTRREANSAGTP